MRDLSGQRFERYVAQWPIGRSKTGKSNDIKWLCLCDCGTVKAVDARHLIGNKIKSCGCYNSDKTATRNKANTIHGKSQSLEGDLLYSARYRAKQTNLPCTIDINDIVIPDICPLLEIPIRKEQNSGHHQNSPSLDRIIPSAGYIKGNVQVISVKANRIKNDSTLDEIKLLVFNWEKQVCAS